MNFAGSMELANLGGKSKRKNSMTQKEMNNAADMLEQWQSYENDGRGISCVRDIVTFLRLGREKEARAIRQWDGDKTRSYPKMEFFLTEIFGCRLHANKDCEHELCSAIHKNILNQLKEK